MACIWDSCADTAGPFCPESPPALNLNYERNHRFGESSQTWKHNKTFNYNVWIMPKNIHRKQNIFSPNKCRHWPRFNFNIMIYYIFSLHTVRDAELSLTWSSTHPIKSWLNRQWAAISTDTWWWRVGIAWQLNRFIWSKHLGLGDFEADWWLVYWYAA